jgi:hypothetical protein
MSSKFYPSFIPVYGYMVSGVSAAAGLKSGQFDRKRNQVLKIPNLKHHLILNLGQINHKFQYSMTETGLEFRSLAMLFHISAASGRERPV